MTGLTVAQAKVFSFIRESSTERGVSPTYREIATHMGYRSSCSVARVIDGLEQRGAIRRRKNQARSIEVVTQPNLVRVKPELFALLFDYAKQEKIGIETATNALLRDALEAA